MAYDAGKVQGMVGSDQTRRLKLTPTNRRTKLDSLGVDAPERFPTQEMRLALSTVGNHLRPCQSHLWTDKRPGRT